MKYLYILIAILFSSLSLTAQEAQEDTVVTYNGPGAEIVQQLISTTEEQESPWWNIFASVDRSRFLPEEMQHMSNSINELMVQTSKIHQSPLTLYQLFQNLEIIEEDKVLIAGYTGAYAAVLLNRYGIEVYLIQENPLKPEGDEISSITGPVNFQYWQNASPFDAILITTAQKELEPQLLNQLAEGSILICPLLTPRGLQQWVKVQKIGMSYNVSLLDMKGSGTFR